MSNDNLTHILTRLETLEAAVLGRVTSRPIDPGCDRRLNKHQLALRRGTSTRTVDRDVERGALPRPEIENGRCYWWLSAIQEHERQRRAREAA
jgi:hypothetical protein